MASRIGYIDAYDEGYEAFSGYEKNPYILNSHSYWEWDRGYRDAEGDYDNEEGPWDDFAED